MDTVSKPIATTDVADFVGLTVGSSVSRVIYDFLTHKVKSGVSIKVGSGKTHTLRIGKENVEFGYLGFGSFKKNPIPTFLSDMALINPQDLKAELDSLTGRKLVSDPWEKLLWCDPSAIVITPYHKAWSQIMELIKVKKNRGTLGSGAGKAYFRASDAPERALYAGELRARDVVRRKLIDTRDYVYMLIKDLSLPALPENATKEDQARYKKDQEIFNDLSKWFNDEGDMLLESVVDAYEFVGVRLQFLTLPEALRKFPGTAVIERSHGVLADAQVGFKPFVSNLRAIPQLFDQRLRLAGYKGPIKRYGVHRAYEYRHNPGPMPTYRPRLRKDLGIAPRRSENRFRGPVRAGALDLPMMAYAISCCGGPDAFNGLIITCFDQIIPLREWNICVRYLRNGGLLPLDERLTTEIISSVSTVDYQIKFKMDQVKDEKSLYEFVNNNLTEYLDFGDKRISKTIPVVGISYGTGDSRMLWRLNKQKHI